MALPQTRSPARALPTASRPITRRYPSERSGWSGSECWPSITNRQSLRRRCQRLCWSDEAGARQLRDAASCQWRRLRSGTVFDPLRGVRLVVGRAVYTRDNRHFVNRAGWFQPLHGWGRSEEHTSELQSLAYLVCRLLLEKKKK